MAAQEVFRRELPLPADCCEFCPWEGQQHRLLVGTYQLKEEQQVREGQLHLFSCERHREEEEESGEVHEGRAGAQVEAGVKVHEDCTVQCPGVFALRWSHPLEEGSDEGREGGAPTVALAGANGSLQLYGLSSSHPQPETEGRAHGQLKLSQEVPLDEHEMCLCCDWVHQRSNSTLLTSHSDGALCEVGRETEEQLQSWGAHSYPGGGGAETWVVTASRWEPSVCFSGADDCCFKGWDLRNTCRPTFLDRRTHGSGVCSITCSPQVPFLLCTGSYDDTLRLWDLRYLRDQQPIASCLRTELPCSGGVWNTKWHPYQNDELLGAYMYGGFGIVRAHGYAAKGNDSSPEEPKEDVSSPAVSCESILSYGTHGSIAYGLDWCRAPHLARCDSTLEGKSATPRRLLVATCSFYDRLLTLWYPPPMPA